MCMEITIAEGDGAFGSDRLTAGKRAALILGWLSQFGC